MVWHRRCRGGSVLAPHCMQSAKQQVLSSAFAHALPALLRSAASQAARVQRRSQSCQRARRSATRRRRSGGAGRSAWPSATAGCSSATPPSRRRATRRRRTSRRRTRRSRRCRRALHLHCASCSIIVLGAVCVMNIVVEPRHLLLRVTWPERLPTCCTVLGRVAASPCIADEGAHRSASLQMLFAYLFGRDQPLCTTLCAQRCAQTS